MAQLTPDDLFARFDQRCRILGASAWWCSAAGRVEIGASPAPSWVSSVALAAVGGQQKPEKVEPKLLAIGMPHRRGAQVLGIAVVAYPSKQSKLEQVLRWTFEDLAAAASDAETLKQFSETLAQAFEETNLLFRLTRLMNGSSAPSQLMTMVCHQLQQVLPFGWVAMKFREDGVEVGDLAGKTLIAGAKPMDPAHFDRLSRAVVNGWSSDDWTKLLEPGKSDLATAVGAEVIAEPIAHDDKVIGALFAGNKANGDPDVTSGEMQFMDAAADILGMFHENVARFSEQRAMFMGMMRSLVAAIDAKDPYTCGHSERVALMATKAAAALGYDEQTVEQYRVAGLLHDVGKIGVPEAVLTKPGRLDPAEFAQIKRHPEIGYHILKGIPLLDGILPGVLHHHERWAGGGYPHGISGEKIPTIARVLALADTFDAMSSDRSYRRAMTRDAVLAEIQRCSGTQFDPALVPVFLKLDFAEFDQHLQRATHKSNAA